MAESGRLAAPRRDRLLRSARQRSAWAVGDQVLSSISNLLLGTVVARNSSADEYGAFAIGFAVMAIALGVSRGLSSDAFLARVSEGQRDRWAAEASDAVAFVLVLGVITSVVLALVAIPAGPTLRPVLWAFAVILSLVLVQDLYRYVLIGGGQANLAAASDAMIIVALLGAMLLLGGRLDSAPRVVLAWGLASGLAALVGALVVRRVPGTAAAARWWRNTRQLGARFALEFALLNGTTQVVMFTLAATSGLAAAAALRGANVVLGPAVIVTTGLVSAAVPEGRRLLGRQDRRFVHGVLWMSFGLSAMTMAWGVMAYWLPLDVGRFLLGDTWLTARPILPLLGLAAGGTAASAGLMAGLRALQAAAASLRATVPLAMLATLGGIVGGVLGGAAGVVIGMTGPLWLGVVLYGRAFRRGVAVVAW